MNAIARSFLKSSVLINRSIPMVSQLHDYSRTSPVMSIITRHFAAADKKKGKKQQEAPKEDTLKSDSLIPINIFVGNIYLFHCYIQMARILKYCLTTSILIGCGICS